MARDANGLTPKQARFVGEYLSVADPDPGSAYLAAGYKAKSRYVAQVCASQLLKRPKVASAIAQAQQKRSDRVQVTQDDVLRGLADIAGLDLADVVADDGGVLDIHGMKEAVRKSLAGLETEEVVSGKGEAAILTRVRKVKLADRIAAYKLLGQHLGMFKDQVEVTGKDGGPLEYIEVVRVPKRERPK